MRLFLFLLFLPVLAFAQTAPPAPVYPIPEARQIAAVGMNLPEGNLPIFKIARLSSSFDLHLSNFDMSD
jgi:hypothetical protein